MSWSRTALMFLLAAIGLAGTGCARREAAVPSGQDGKRRLVFQTDWLPQAEQGGFYQALAKGYYDEAGLDVEIVPGGINAQINLKVARGDADIGMNRSDLLMAAQDRGLPLVIVAAYLQHDPQALLVHASSPVKSFKDLDGHTVIAAPSMPWIAYVQHTYGVSFQLRPMAHGLASFLADPGVVQQGFVTNEPYFAQRQGVAVRTLMISESGYDAYHVIFARRELWRQDPDVVRRFVEASFRGWRDYLEGDPAPAHQEILRRNPQTDPGQLAYSREQMLVRKLVTGDAAEGDGLGRIRRTRVDRQIAALRGAGVIDGEFSVDEAFVPGAVSDDR